MLTVDEAFLKARMKARRYGEDVDAAEHIWAGTADVADAATEETAEGGSGSVMARSSRWAHGEIKLKRKGKCDIFFTEVPARPSFT